MSKVIVVGDENWETEVLGSPLPVLVDCWAEWCGPCRLMEPEVHALAEEEADRLKVVSLNVDNYPILTQDYCAIEMLPTCILFVGGDPKVRVTGYAVKNEILWEVEPHLARRPQDAGGAPPTTSMTSEY